jgi:hypothetical protein
LVNALTEIGPSHQVLIHLPGCPAAFIDGPNHQGLSTAGITGGKNPRFAGGVFSVWGFDVRSRVFLQIKGLERRFFGS